MSQGTVTRLALAALLAAAWDLNAASSPQETSLLCSNCPGRPTSTRSNPY